MDRPFIKDRFTCCDTEWLAICQAAPYCTCPSKARHLALGEDDRQPQTGPLLGMLLWVFIAYNSQTSATGDITGKMESNCGKLEVKKGEKTTNGACDGRIISK